MGVEFEAQNMAERQQVRTREIQQESVEQLGQITDMVNDVNFDNIESNTEEIKELVVNNLENQVDNDDIFEKLDKISKSISDVKRNQTNLTKKINDIQNKIGE